MKFDCFEGERERERVYGRLSRAAISKTDMKKLSVGKKFRTVYVLYQSVKLNKR